MSGNGDGPLVHLIDAPVYVFRAYHSLPPLEAPDGAPVGAAYGFASTLLKYLTDTAATHAAAAFDFSQESFRNVLEPAYKAQRGDPPPDLEAQFALCAELCEALGVPAFEAPGFEADDVIATLVQSLLREGARVRVVTSDKDLAQLVREDGRVVLHDLARGATLDADGVRARYGVDPDRIPDWLGLVGDSVDNLPGVPGVGPRGAAAALAAFGRIEAVPADPGAWPATGLRGVGRLAGLIEAHRARALRTRALATLVREVPGLPVGAEPLRYRGADRARTLPLFERLGWGRIATRIPRWS